MYILLISALPPPIGGIARWTEQWVINGLQDGHQFKLINSAICGKRKIFEPSKFSWQEIRRIFSIFSMLLFHLIFYRPDVIHFNISVANKGVIRDFFYVFLIKLFKIKLVVQYHGDLNRLYLANAFFGLSIFFTKKIILFSNANLFLNTQSLKLAKELIKDKVRQKHFYILPNFIDEKVFQYQAKFNWEANHRLKTVFIGAITAEKGCRELIELARIKTSVDIFMIGELKPDLNLNLDLPRNIHILGYLDHESLLKKISDMDCLIFPSYFEGFPNAVLESMAVGLPVIATRVGAIADMIDAGKGGFIVEPKTIGSLVEALERLENQHDLVKNMGEYNRKKCYDCYRYSRVIIHLVRIYLDLN